MIRVLVADDHPIVREGLKQVIAKDVDMTVVGEALNGQELLDKVYADPVDVVVMDFAMPGRSGIDVLKELKRERPKLPVLILSMYPENELAPRVLKAGASGYMTKESAPKELVQAIRKLHLGGKYVSAALADKLVMDFATNAHRLPHEALSDREYQVLVMIASSKSMQEVADELSLSIKTVRTYRDRILEKMQVKNVVGLTHYALQHGLISGRDAGSQ
jgi:two-component system, NarL family, invasion response regulator UvrY